MDGWTGRCLRVDLSSGQYRHETIAQEQLAFALGGRGFAVTTLFQEIDPQIAPLSPDNKIIITSGPLVGTGAVTGASCNIVTKSPLSDCIACAKTRGHFGAELKFAGFDMLIIEGCSQHPVFLTLIDDKISIQPALEYWGRTTSETERMFKRAMHDKWAPRETYLLTIGPAGENQLPLANMVTDGFLVFDGAGIGAVMGAKNLKGIAVKGSHSLTVADGTRFVQVVTTLINKINSSPLTSQSLRSWGSAFFVGLCYQQSILPFKNFQSPSYQEAHDIGPEAIENSFSLRSRACFGCPIACIKMTNVNDPLMKGRGMAPTYMAIGALGLNLGITNLSTIGMANILCSEMGLDPIATGGTLSTAMEMVERGYLTSEELKLELGFGREEQVIQAIQRMSTQKGHAKRIGQGGWALCQKYGHKDLFMGVKKIPMAPFDPRAIQGMGLHFATSSLGPHHIYAYTFIDEILHVHDHDSDPGEVVGKPELVKEYQDVTAVMDCLGLCNWPFLVLKLKNFVPLVNSCLGTNYTREDLLTFGERTWNIERLFNLQAGTKREDDTLPQRFFDQSLKNATAQRQISRLQEMIQPYYTLRGWDDQGRPTEEMLHRLSLTGEPYA